MKNNRKIYSVMGEDGNTFTLMIDSERNDIETALNEEAKIKNIPQIVAYKYIG